MKILYAVQATGNGHISRARELFPFLQDWGEVDLFLSGSNATLDIGLPVRYRSNGLSLFYSPCGGLDYRQTLRRANPLRVIREARDLPVERYDLVINDFEHITSRACRLKGVPSVQFGHQASFRSPLAPRPSSRDMVGEIILKRYAPATHYVGLHFLPYDEGIFPPVIKSSLHEANPTDAGHLSVYLPAYQRHCLEPLFRALAPRPVHWFLAGIDKVHTEGHITYLPIRQDLFDESLILCHALLTGGGFETPAEALFLGKKVMAVPIRGQYEQQCNAAALKELGVPVLPTIDASHEAGIRHWLDTPSTAYRIRANDVRATLQHVMDLDHGQAGVLFPKTTADTEG
jgi:uncharacterized protein (TIGR00661 family)